MAVPKRKTSKMKKRQRRGSDAQQRRDLPTASEDKRDGGMHIPHRICPTTGMYKGRQVLTVSTDD